MDNRFAELDMGQPIEVEKPEAAKAEKPGASNPETLAQRPVTEPLSIEEAARIVDAARRRNRQVQNDLEELMRAQQRMAEQAARERAMAQQVIPMTPPYYPYQTWANPGWHQPPRGNAHGLWRDERDRLFTPEVLGAPSRTCR
jgi:hypothetical protein